MCKTCAIEIFQVQFRKIIICYKKTGYNKNVMLENACLVVIPITVNNFVRFNWTPDWRLMLCLWSGPLRFNGLISVSSSATAEYVSLFHLDSYVLCFVKCLLTKANTKAKVASALSLFKTPSILLIVLNLCSVIYYLRIRMS